MAAAQVLVYIGAISVLVLFAIMLTQTKAAPSSLVFQTQAFPAAIASAILALLIAIIVASTDWPATRHRASPTSATDLATALFNDYVLAFEVVSVLLLAAVIGGVFLAKRERGGTRANAQRPRRHLAVARRLPDPLGRPVRDRQLRLPRPAQRDLDADVDRADAQRRQPLDHLVRRVHRTSLNVDASVIALIVMAAAAAEATVGLAIVIAIYRNRKTPLVDEYDAMRQ